MNAPVLLLRWISSFLRDRRVNVRILGHTSREIAINYGVPQGSPISLLLFLLYMSKLPTLLPNTRRSLFDDDFVIYSESSITRSDLIQFNLQTSMGDLTLFNADHRIILNCTKSIRVRFERKKSNMLTPQDVTYKVEVIPSSSSVKLLSIPSFIHNDRKRQHAYLPPIHDRNIYLAKRWYRRAMQHNRGVTTSTISLSKRTNRGAHTTPLELIRN